MLNEVRQKLESEISELDHELRLVLPKEIKKALEHGDLRENSEYKSALERQEYVKARLAQLKRRVSELATMDLSRLPTDRIAYGTTVELENFDTGEKARYKLVMPEEAEIEQGHISVASPIAKALLGHEAGDDVVIHTPRGAKSWSITRIRTIHDESA